MKLPRGFTLIELLVVIAIIGLLAAVVLASLSTAKSKGNDAAIEEQMRSVGNAAELYYSQNGGYGIGTSAGACSGLGSLWVSPIGNMSNIITAIVSGAQAVDCGTAVTPAQWSIAALLPTGAVFCIDNQGYAGLTVKDGASAGQAYTGLTGGTGGGTKAHATAGDSFCN